MTTEEQLRCFAPPAEILQGLPRGSQCLAAVSAANDPAGNSVAAGHDFSLVASGAERRADRRTADLGWLAQFFSPIVSKFGDSKPAWLRASDGTFLYANDAFAQIVDASSAKSVVGKLDTSLLGDRRTQRLRQHDRHVLDAGGPRIVLEPPGAIDQQWAVTMRFPAQWGAAREAVAGVVFSIMDWLSIEEMARPSIAPPSGPVWLGRALAVVDRQYRHPVRLRSLGNLFGRNCEYLGRVFAEFTGATVSQYVRARRVAWAAEQIRSSDVLIAYIAIDAGFSDQSHLTREFRTFAGITPSSLRDRPSPVKSLCFR